MTHRLQVVKDPHRDGGHLFAKAILKPEVMVLIIGGDSPVKPDALTALPF